MPIAIPSSIPTNKQQMLTGQSGTSWKSWMVVQFKLGFFNNNDYWRRYPIGASTVKLLVTTGMSKYTLCHYVSNYESLLPASDNLQLLILVRFGACRIALVLGADWAKRYRRCSLVKYSRRPCLALTGGQRFLMMSWNEMGLRVWMHNQLYSLTDTVTLTQVCKCKLNTTDDCWSPCRALHWMVVDSRVSGDPFSCRLYATWDPWLRQALRSLQDQWTIDVQQRWCRRSAPWVPLTTGHHWSGSAWRQHRPPWAID